MVAKTPSMSKSIHYFRFYRQSKDGATIPEEELEESDRRSRIGGVGSEESDRRRSTVDAIGVLI